MEIELYVRCCPLYPSCHHLQSEQTEVEDMDMSEVEGMDMSEVQCINMVEEQNHPTNHCLGEVGDMDMVEEYYHLMNHRSYVESMDREDSCMGEDITVEVEVVEREHEGVVLTRHWTNDGAKRHR
jgi:hypothetical protein